MPVWEPGRGGVSVILAAAISIPAVAVRVAVVWLLSNEAGGP